MNTWLIYDRRFHVQGVNLMANRHQLPIRAGKPCDEPQRVSLDEGDPSLDILSIPINFKLTEVKAGWKTLLGCAETCPRLFLGRLSLGDSLCSVNGSASRLPDSHVKRSAAILSCSLKSFR